MTTHMSDLDTRIANHAHGPIDDTTTLREAGLDSLALVRLAVEVAADEDTEIDAARMAGLRTVGDLKSWLSEMR
ncbi:acyl carrier protein [Kibdelosporangium persicum]|uniref:Phosphopantetheine attachment site n=1 Tax=Kibdelosporangium persicum TaxID=2698649 RepID=A0ABX2FI84_9PSEU|nr:acyl carrier protein [Kibdelosporangium persicum]NRN70987.1 Phosphopantetheine attachment site [Kibdelosporangium persicum]